MRKSLLIILFFIARLNAQQVYFQKINQLELPSNECYNIIQDSQGYLWLGTSGGLAKFNGDSVTKLKKPGTTKDEPTFKITELTNGTLLVSSSPNYFYTVDKTGKAKEAGFTKKLNELITNKLLQVYQITNVQDSLLYLSTQYTTYKVNLNNNYIKQIFPFDTVADYAFEIINNKIIQYKRFFKPEEITKIIKTQTIVIAIKVKDHIIKFTSKINSKVNPSWRTNFTSNNKGDHFLSFDNLLVKIDRNLKITTRETKSAILSLYIDKDLNLWTGTLRGGLYMFRNSDIRFRPLINLSEYSITGVFEDNERSLWCTTLEGGLFYCRNKDVIYYPEIKDLSKFAYGMKVIDNYFYCSSLKNRMVAINDTSILEFENPKIDDYLIRIIIHKGRYLVATTRSLLEANTNFSELREIKLSGINQALAPSYLFELGGDTILMAITNEIYLSRSGNITTVAIPEYKIQQMIQAGQRILIAMNNCIYEYKLKNNFTKLITLKNEFRKMRVREDGTILVIDAEGITSYENNQASDLLTKHDLPRVKINDATEDDKRNLWLSTDQGLIKVNNNGDWVKYTTNNGLLNNKIASALICGNRIYCNTADGIFAFPTEVKAPDAAPVFKLTSLLVNGKEYHEETEYLKFEHNQNSLVFNYEVLSYINLNKPARLEYRVKEFSGEWIKTEGKKIRFDNLPPGKYNIEVRAINAFAIPSIDVQKIQVIIKPPYWRSWWFLLSIFTLVSIIIVLLVRSKIRKVRIEEEEKTKIQTLISEYQMSALQAQMNPHFVFNVINSIQTYVLENESQLAYDYLTKFSRLIRTVLEMARQKTILLESELSALNNYIELEQMRLDNTFDYEIFVDDNLNIHSIKIPPLLLQPYVENAIWHGLTPIKKVRRGKLKVSVLKKGNDFVVIIEDNGVGREQSKLIKKEESHLSVGMNIGDERIQALKNIPEYRHAKIEIFDLYLEDGQSCGTKIELFLPIIVDKDEREH